MAHSLRRRLVQFALAGCLGLATQASAQQVPPNALLRLGVERGDFRAELADGRILRGADLVGAELRILQNGRVLSLRVESAEADTRPHAGDVWLFHLTFAGADGARHDYCQPDPEGRSRAIPYPKPDEPQGFAITCSAGAIGKCLRFGYRPWAQAPDGRSLAPYFPACVNMVRAAYGAPERGWTRNGMAIDFWDDAGLHEPADDPSYLFEAGWTAEGAVCVAHTRVPEHGSVMDVAREAPRLAAHVGPERCNEAAARAAGAIILNRSPRRS
ncbi:hypothetical protein KTR66_06425 [Roseococcus sp. SDR]|uniref:ADYC domain-containing protein n=1 Tax=Roseococcus sp. SDR TaxID=2835532 RepID=UPI001BCDBA16|nr:ADYC domain-containing protein [Roseococcus sp. SDR]MBS7789619.1 hypothetical protein [Roseococcus sp. SDR]MBV1844933.1 hypothetical protein [Roseococcus sp. SDR]